jgi:hypothetical protein
VNIHTQVLIFPHRPMGTDLGYNLVFFRHSCAVPAEMPCSALDHQPRKQLESSKQ